MSLAPADGDERHVRHPLYLTGVIDPVMRSVVRVVRVCGGFSPVVGGSPTDLGVGDSGGWICPNCNAYPATV